MKYPSLELCEALKAADFARVCEALKAGADANHVTDSGEYPLLLAIRHAGANAVKVLLQYGAEPDGAGVRFRNPIITAVRRDQTGIVASLAEAGADFGPYPSEMSALSWAAWHRNLPMLDLLVAHGADVNAVDESDETVLSRSFLNPDVMTGLLALGAVPRDAETHIVKLCDFPRLAQRPEFVALKQKLAQLTGGKGLEYWNVAGTFTAIVPAERYQQSPEALKKQLTYAERIRPRQMAIREVTSQFYDEALQADCLLIDAREQDRRGAFLVLFPMSDKFAAMAALAINDWPDGQGPYGLIEGLKTFDQQIHFRLLGCSRNALKRRFEDPTTDGNLAVNRLNELFRANSKLSPGFDFTEEPDRVTVYWEGGSQLR